MGSFGYLCLVEKKIKQMESKLKSGNPCKRFLYLDKDGVPVFKDKVKYKTKAEAQKKADEFNKQDKAIHYAVPLPCM